MPRFDDVDQELNDFALPPLIDEISVPAPLKFEPWHKPRKQYVRRNQWIHHATETIRRMKNNGALKDEDAVAYLTLPGPDMLDVRLMAEACQAEGVKLRYTGFCNVAENEAIRLRRNTAQFQIDLDGTIQAGSEVHAMQLEEIVVPKSAAGTMMERGGPYTVINLDACEPLAKRDPNHTSRLIDAVRKIITYQINNSRQSWLLYLTTPVQVDWISSQSLDALKNEIRKNCDSDAAFFSGLSAQFSHGEGLESYLARTSAESGEAFCSMFSLGIAKWILHLAEQGNFRMIKKKSFSYSMVKKPPFFPNMISTCYLFSPLPLKINDDSGLTHNVQTQAGGTLAKSAHIHALERSISLENIDSLFVKEPNLMMEMMQQTKSLLAMVGYNVDDPESGYDAWLRGEGIGVIADHVNLA